MDDLTAFQRDALYVIAGMDEPYGLALKRELDEYYAESINHGRLYPNLDALTELGLVRKGKHDERTNSYSVTQAGRRVLQQRREWESNSLDVDDTSTAIES
jgi:PadR family transcriptional regulator PadR